MKVLLASAVILAAFWAPATFAESLHGLQPAAELELEESWLGFLGAESYFMNHNVQRCHPRDPRCRRDDRRRDRGIYVCFAENRWRELFRGQDRSAQWAQRNAMRKCERVSGRCQPLGCRFHRR